MKKLVSLLLLLVCSASLAACGTTATSEMPAESLPATSFGTGNITASTPPAESLPTAASGAGNIAASEIENTILDADWKPLQIEAPVLVLPTGMVGGADAVFDRENLHPALELNIQQLACTIIQYYQSGWLPFPQYEESEPMWAAAWPEGVAFEHNPTVYYNAVTIREENEKYGGYNVYVDVSEATDLVIVMYMELAKDGDNTVFHLVAPDGWFVQK